jgi:hypothetical protein
MIKYLAKRYQASLGKLKLMSNDTAVEVVACIGCYEEDPKKVSRLVIGFIPDNKPLPPNCVKPLNTAFRPISEYYYYLDMLRNEKPVYIIIDIKRPYWHRIQTGTDEPVGEGETRNLF